MPQTIYVALGVITAALFTSIISLINLITAKEQKVSEFRQNWIDDLRKDIAKYNAGINTFSVLCKNIYEKNFNKNDDVIENETSVFFNENSDLLKDIKDTYYRILLRINPKEHKIFVENISDPYIIYKSKKITDVEYFSELSNHIVVESQKMLKKEWRRVKRGEPVFFIVKWFTFSVMVVLITTLILSIVYSNEIMLFIQTHN